ncbi:hypothetical protein ABZ820_10090 [Streptomyces diacarni]|uniref:hypothetical protein n=1 Tax=Streptomyces diacarni TaxID=2800381 RepID=UPI0033E9C8BD
MSPQQYYEDGLRVPYVASWQYEDSYMPTPVERRHGVGGAGIGYQGEARTGGVDRRNGVLWVRAPLARGRGRARLGSVHPLRQRQAMSHLLCQVCGADTFDRNDERHMVLVRGETPIREGERTASPPVHESCAAESVRDCPHLRRGHVAALVRHFQPWGVAGLLHHPKTLKVRYSGTRDGLTFVEFGDPRIRWTLAARDVSTLHGVETVDLDDLHLTA